MHAIEVDVDDGRFRLAIDAVILADREEPAPGTVEAQVAVAVRTLGGDGDRRVDARVEAVQPAVDEVGEDDGPAGDDIRAPAVLVDPRSDVERRRGQVDRRPVAGTPDQDAPAGLGGSSLDPVDVVAVDPRLGQPDDVRDEIVDADRRDPAPERRDRRGGRDRSLTGLGPLGRAVLDRALLEPFLHDSNATASRRLRGAGLTCRAATRRRTRPAPRSSARARCPGPRA